jgi:hypothetical protein
MRVEIVATHMWLLWAQALFWRPMSGLRPVGLLGGGAARSGRPVAYGFAWGPAVGLGWLMSDM